MTELPKHQMFAADSVAAPLRHAVFRRIWLASQIRRNTACRSGAATLSAANVLGFGWSVMVRPGGAGRGRPSIPCDPK